MPVTDSADRRGLKGSSRGDVVVRRQRELSRRVSRTQPGEGDELAREVGVIGEAALGGDSRPVGRVVGQAERECLA